MKKKDAKQLFEKISQILKVNIKNLFGFLPNIEQAKTQDFTVFFLNGKLLLAEADAQLFPTLVFQQIFSYLPKIVVDIGAVPYVCNGADVMAPGVVCVQGTFNQQDFILIIDEQHEKVLAVAKALIDSKAIITVKHGKVAKNVHHVGDKLWNLLKNIPTNNAK